MNHNLMIVLISSLVATFNPTLLAAVTVMLLLPHPKRLMLGYLLGAYTTSLVSGLAIVFVLHGTSAANTSTHLLTPGGQIVIGAVALCVAFLLATGHETRLHDWRERRKTAHTNDQHTKEPWQTRMLGKGSVLVTFTIGAAMSFPGASYVNALDHIAQLNPPTISILLLVAYFCVMQQILIEGALLASTFAANRTQDLVVRLKGWITSHGRQITTVGLSGLGILLTARGVLAIS
jgi:hypothetical protein